MFVDKARITIRSGKGGNGSVSFRREPFVPDGGPDGGDGGKGGDVVFVADSRRRTLMDFRYKRKYVAEDGADGRKKKQTGKSGEPCIIPVPTGTVIIDRETERILGDLTRDGERYLALRGGKGGKGNVHFKSSTRQAPNFAEAGGASREKHIDLVLKLIADVGLIGFPNVGKSTLLSVVTEAQPKIGNYPFTTLYPNLGVVERFDDSFIIADIPGLIAGAHTGAGLGLDFLRHIERTRLLVHVVDVSGVEGRDPIDDFHTINREMAAYQETLSARPQIVAANKTDIADPDKLAEFVEHVEALGYPVYPIAAALHRGVTELLEAIQRALGELPQPEPPALDLWAEAEPDEEPDYRELHWSKDGNVYVLAGKQLEKIFDSTNFNDLGSRRYLYRYIEKRGGIAGLKALGLREGDTVRIRDSEFVFAEEAID